MLQTLIDSPQYSALWRLPMRALPRRNLLHIHGINLLKAPALTLTDEEVDDHSTDEITCGKDVTVLVIDVICNERGEESNEEVESPIGSRGETHGLGTVPGRVDFSNECPDDGSPCLGVDKALQSRISTTFLECEGRANSHEQAREHNHDKSGRPIGRARVYGRLEQEGAHGREDHEAHEHPQAPKDERLSATEILDDIKSTKGTGKIDPTQNHGHGEGDKRRRDLCKDLCSVVEEIVCARKLLQRLQRDA